MPKYSLSDQVLIQLVEQEWSDQRIAEQHGISRQAVQRRRVKLLGKKQTIAAEVNELLRDLWPAYAPAGERGHNRYYDIRHLRNWLRLQYGDKIPKEEEKLARAWVFKMETDSAVLCYDPDSEEPWFHRARRLDDDRLLVDWPKSKRFPTEKFRQALTVPRDTRVIEGKI